MANEVKRPMVGLCTDLTFDLRLSDDLQNILLGK